MQCSKQFQVVPVSDTNELPPHKTSKVISHTLFMFVRLAVLDGVFAWEGQIPKVQVDDLAVIGIEIKVPRVISRGR